MKKRTFIVFDGNTYSFNPDAHADGHLVEVGEDFLTRFEKMKAEWDEFQSMLETIYKDSTPKVWH
jgi:hypothetical protein